MIEKIKERNAKGEKADEVAQGVFMNVFIPRTLHDVPNAEVDQLKAKAGSDSVRFEEFLAFLFSFFLFLVRFFWCG
jgi:hypothetical protein